MKRIIVISCFMVYGCLLNAQTLFSYGRHQVDKEEFLQAFYKNNTGDKSERAMREYLNLYIAFKLKVQAAKERKIDTLPSQRNDLLNFRRQIEADYLTEDSVTHALVNEAFARSQKDIRVSHIFIPFEESYIQNSSAYSDNSVVDTLTAWQNIQKAYAALKNGGDFGSTADKYSLDPSVKTNKGDIGFITVFSLPYRLESIAYTLQNGEFSPPYKSRAGYHIIQKTAERPAIGKIRAAQILLSYTPGASAAEKQQQKKLADSLYVLLKNGSDFETLVQQFSTERNAHTTGGLMPDFGVGRYDAGFENLAFSLKKDGAVSTPVETAFGIHIVKRIKYLPVSDDRNQAETLFKESVLQDSRVSIASEKFAEQMIHRIGYQKKMQDQLLWQITDSFLVHQDFTPLNGVTDQTVLFSFDKENTTLKDWLVYMQTAKHNFGGVAPIPYPTIMDEFVSRLAKEYYRIHLEDYNARFRNQLTEFSEGNQLFEIMDQQVWTKASEDKKGLQQYYDQHKEQYNWEPNSVNAIFFTTIDRKTAEEVRNDIDNYINKWKTLGESTTGKIIADSSRFEMAQIPGGHKNIQPGQLTKLVTDTSNGSTNFMYVLNVYNQPAQKSFEEARGLVINDYQMVLEEKWIAALKKKYPVRVNEKLLRTLTQ